MAEDDDEPLPVFLLLSSVMLTHISVVATLLTGSWGELLGEQAPDGTGLFGAGLVLAAIVVFLPGVSVAVWAGIHGVDVALSLPTGRVTPDPVPFLGILDGVLVPVVFLLAVGVGAAIASELGGSALDRAVGGTAVGAFVYLFGGLVATHGSAFLFNRSRDFLGVEPGDLGFAVVYASPVDTVVQMAVLGVPLVAVGALLNAADHRFLEDRTVQDRRQGRDAQRGGPSATERDPDPGPPSHGAPDNDEGDPGEGTRVFEPTADDRPGTGEGSGDREWREEWYEEDRRRNDRR